MILASHQRMAIEMGCGFDHETLDEILRAIGIEPGSPEDTCIRMPDKGILSSPELRTRALEELQ